MLALTLQPQLVLAMECSVCEQFISQDEGDYSVIRLVGAARFSSCCCCGQKVENGGDDFYKMRYASWERKRAA
jgi:hypothetical protein